MSSVVHPAQPFEIRLYGLHSSVTTEALTKFFTTGVKVVGVLLHPSSPGPEQPPLSEPTQWAQIWTTSEEEVKHCLSLRADFEEKNITIARAPVAQHGWLMPESKADVSGPGVALPSSTSIDDLFVRDEVQPEPSSLARNLYVLSIPVDMTQHQFKGLFVDFGMVEHSTLLSQLDGSGRRRGFILMSTHQEAKDAMASMNGRYINGCKMDVSWALVQRENKHFQAHGAFPNRVVHPPNAPAYREPSPDCSVLVENLDPVFFPNANTIREIFTHFGPVIRVTIIPGETLTALISFEHKVCADAVVKSDGMSLGGRAISTKALIPARPRTPPPVPSQQQLSVVWPLLPPSSHAPPRFPPQKDEPPRATRPLPSLPLGPVPTAVKLTQLRSAGPTIPRRSPLSQLGAIGDELKNLKIAPCNKLNPDSQAFVPGAHHQDDAEGTGTSQEATSSSPLNSSGRSWCK